MLLIVFMLRFQRGFARILGNPERKFTQRWFRDRQEYRSIYKKKTRVKRSRRTWKVLIFDDRWRCDNFDHWRCCDFFSQLSFDCLTSKLSHRNYNGVFVRAAAWKEKWQKKGWERFFSCCLFICYRHVLNYLNDVFVLLLVSMVKSLKDVEGTVQPNKTLAVIFFGQGRFKTRG